MDSTRIGDLEAGSRRRDEVADALMLPLGAVAASGAAMAGMWLMGMWPWS
jgi:hypothetical protein